MPSEWDPPHDAPHLGCVLCVVGVRHRIGRLPVSGDVSTQRGAGKQLGCFTNVPVPTHGNCKAMRRHFYGRSEHVAERIGFGGGTVTVLGVYA